MPDAARPDALAPPAPPPSSSILATDLAGIALRNPVMLAAGTAGLLDELGTPAGPLDLSRVGAVVTKSITPEAREGNATCRIIEHRAGMLNAIGLANPGIDNYEERTLPRAAAVSTVVVASVAGFAVGDYVRVAGTLDEWADRGIRAVELNVSCPNVQTGIEFGSSAQLMRELCAAVRPVVKRAKLFVKLSPATCDIVAVARAAVEGGADALTVGNTMPAMAIDVRTRRVCLANVTGGLSGPGLHPVAVRLVHEVYRKVTRLGMGDGRGVGRVPIIGAGGVMTWEDAAEFILAGASAVQMGTALFADPRSPVRVARGLERWVRAQKCSSIAELVGAVTLP